MPVIQDLSGFFSPEVSTMLDVKKLKVFLSDQNQSYSTLDMVSAADLNFIRGSTCLDGLKSLANMTKKLSDQFQSMVDSREEALSQASKKKAAVRDVKNAAANLAPLLKKHALRIGVGKGQDLNISQGCANVSTMYKMFAYTEVEDAHREIEAARNHIMQDMTIRRLHTAKEEVSGKGKKRERS